MRWTESGSACILGSIAAGCGSFGLAIPSGATRLVEEAQVLETIVGILIILWLVGLVTSHTMGGLVHILLVIALVVIVVRVIQGRKSLG